MLTPSFLLNRTKELPIEAQLKNWNTDLTETFGTWGVKIKYFKLRSSRDSYKDRAAIRDNFFRKKNISSEPIPYRAFPFSVLPICYMKRYTDKYYLRASTVAGLVKFPRVRFFTDSLILKNRNEQSSIVK